MAAMIVIGYVLLLVALFVVKNEARRHLRIIFMANVVF